MGYPIVLITLLFFLVSHIFRQSHMITAKELWEYRTAQATAWRGCKDAALLLQEANPAMPGNYILIFHRLHRWWILPFENSKTSLFWEFQCSPKTAVRRSTSLLWQLWDNVLLTSVEDKQEPGPRDPRAFCEITSWEVGPGGMMIVGLAEKNSGAKCKVPNMISLINIAGWWNIRHGWNHQQSRTHTEIYGALHWSTLTNSSMTISFPLHEADIFPQYTGPSSTHFWHPKAPPLKGSVVFFRRHSMRRTMAKASWMLRNKDITLAVPGRNICTSFREGQLDVMDPSKTKMPTAHL